MKKFILKILLLSVCLADAAYLNAESKSIEQGNTNVEYLQKAPSKRGLRSPSKGYIKCIYSNNFIRFDMPHYIHYICERR